jgi:hypothetical protein
MSGDLCQLCAQPNHLVRDTQILPFYRIYLVTGLPFGTPRTGWKMDRSSAARTISQVQRQYRYLYALLVHGANWSATSLVVGTGD